MEKGIISESKWKVGKVEESDEEEKDFESYDRSDGTPVHVDVEKEQAVDKPTFALLPNRYQEDDINKKGETGDADGNISLHRLSRRFKPPERLSSVLDF